MRYFLLFLIASAGLVPLYAQAQDKPLFTGAELLDSCIVDLPLTYAKRDKARYTAAANAWKEEELIYLVYDKKSGKGRYTRVYVVPFTSKDGREFVYIESSADHHRTTGAKQALFPKFEPARQRFYRASCFDRQLAAHPELKGTVVPKTDE